MALIDSNEICETILAENKAVQVFPFVRSRRCSRATNEQKYCPLMSSRTAGLLIDHARMILRSGWCWMLRDIVIITRYSLPSSYVMV